MPKDKLWLWLLRVSQNDWFLAFLNTFAVSCYWKNNFFSYSRKYKLFKIRTGILSCGNLWLLSRKLDCPSVAESITYSSEETPDYVVKSDPLDARVREVAYRAWRCVYPQHETLWTAEYAQELNTYLQHVAPDLHFRNWLH